VLKFSFFISQIKYLLSLHSSFKMKFIMKGGSFLDIIATYLRCYILVLNLFGLLK
jgi:hypothetical protein